MNGYRNLRDAIVSAMAFWATEASGPDAHTDSVKLMGQYHVDETWELYSFVGISSNESRLLVNASVIHRRPCGEDCLCNACLGGPSHELSRASGSVGWDESERSFA